MSESVFEELKRYVRFTTDDEARLRAFGPLAGKHFPGVADAFYARIAEHEPAHRVFSGPEQIERLKKSLRDWMQLLFDGPWDAAYHQRRMRIGRVHVQISLPQRYMFGAMDVIRMQLVQAVELELEPSAQPPLLQAVHKILDLELAIILESYREAYVEQVQHAERLERDDLQRRLAVSEARYEEIVEKAEALITTLDQEGRVLLFNAKCERLTGLSRAEAHGLRWLDLFVAKSDHAEVRSRQQQTLRGQPTAAYEGAVPVVAKAPCRVRWQFTTLPGAGAEPALCAIGVDVSNEHELDVRTRRAERLASLGTMAAGLAHEIRNPLNAAHLQLRVAQRRLQREHGDIRGAETAVQVADAEIERLGALVKDFLEFARPQPLRLARLDLRDVVQSSVALLAPEAHACQVQLEFQEGPPALLEFDYEKIKQVLLNLLRNAMEANPPGGRIDVSVVPADSVVELVVRDDGPGVPSDAPIFEPFFTTKEQGTGLGLAIVHRIVMDHGGQITVHSRPGDTQFRVTLPRTRPA